MLVVAALALLLVCATPALAGARKVTSGSTALTVPAPRVTAFTTAHVAVVNVAPVAFAFRWDGTLSWWYRAPMAAGGSYDAVTRKGALVHRGGLRFVNVDTGAGLLLTGLRVKVDGSSGVTLQAAVGGPPVTRADVLVSTNEAAYEKKGKQVTLRGVQFRMTTQLAVALQTALVGTFDTTPLFAVGDLSFKLK